MLANLWPAQLIGRVRSVRFGVGLVETDDPPQLQLVDTQCANASLADPKPSNGKRAQRERSGGQGAKRKRAQR